MDGDIEKVAYRIDEAVKASGLGRSFLYERIAAGDLKSVKVGGRRLILRADLVSFLNSGGGQSGAIMPDVAIIPSQQN
jgi:excisionase family DNA binding protein